MASLREVLFQLMFLTSLLMAALLSNHGAAAAAAQGSSLGQPVVAPGSGGGGPSGAAVPPTRMDALSEELGNYSGMDSDANRSPLDTFEQLNWEAGDAAASWEAAQEAAWRHRAASGAPAPALHNQVQPADVPAVWPTGAPYQLELVVEGGARNSPAVTAAMLRELIADTKEAAAVAASATAAVAAARPATTLPPAALPAASSTRVFNWTLEFAFRQDQVGISSPKSAANASERGAFDIRAGFARKRRAIQLPGSTSTKVVRQETVEYELFFSISGLALAILGSLALLAVAVHCLSNSSEEGEEGDDDEGSEDSKAEPFIVADSEAAAQKLGYSKL